MPTAALPAVQHSNMAYDQNFAFYYDIITGHKDYKSEVKKLAQYFGRQGKDANAAKVLDVGCGTGTHALFLDKLGYNVTGIDISENMIRMAGSKTTNVTFYCTSVPELRERGFDFCYSLFNVINCLTSYNELVAFFRAVHGKLKKNACFVFECWNLLTVVKTPPQIVERTYTTDQYKICRKAIPECDFMEQRIDLIYKVQVYLINENARYRDFTVRHNLLLFTVPQIRSALSEAGFDDVKIHSALPEMNVRNYAGSRMLCFACFKKS